MEYDFDVDYFEYNKICYHGHKREVIDKTIERGRFNLSDEDWEYLGTGVYFFEEDIQQAISWCTRVKNYEDWSIIKSRIKAEKLLDFVNTNHFNELKSFVKKVRTRYRSIGGLKQVNTKLIFDILYELEPYDVIRHAFCVGEDPENIYPTPITRMQIQVCVRNQDCIRYIEEVETNGC